VGIQAHDAVCSRSLSERIAGRLANAVMAGSFDEFR